MVHYRYAKKIYQLGDDFLRLSLKRQPEEIYKLCNDEFRKTTSLAEVVLLTETIYGFVRADEGIVWHRTHIKKRRGFAIIHGTIFGVGKRRFDLTLTAKRGRNQRWYIQALSLKRDYSRSIVRGD